MRLGVPSRRPCAWEYNAIRISGSLNLLLDPAPIGCHTNRWKDWSDAIDQLLFDMRFGILDLFFECQSPVKSKMDNVE